MQVTVQVTVTEKHLEKALAVPSSKRNSENCIMSQAISEALGGVHVISGYDSASTSEKKYKMIGSQVIPLIHSFDSVDRSGESESHQYINKIKKMLPIVVNLE